MLRNQRLIHATAIAGIVGTTNAIWTAFMIADELNPQQRSGEGELWFPAFAGVNKRLL